MKKSLSLILVLALILSMFAFVGCGSEGEDGGEGTEAEALAVTIVVPSGFGDKSFNDSAHDGGERLKSEYGVDVKYIECNNEGHKQQMMNAADVSDIVVCVGWEFWEITDVVTEYPDVKFIWIDNTVESPADYDNLINVVYAQNEGSYLVGYIAAAMSETGVIGAVGGNDDTTINDFIIGYTEGAQAYNPDIQVVKNYAGGDYENPALGKENALALNDLGADVIFQIAGNTGSGVFDAAKERGFYAIGVDKDQKIELQNFDDIILCSMVKNVGNSIVDLVVNYQEDGTFEGGQIWVADMANGYVGIGYGDANSKQLVSEELKAQVMDIQADIAVGNITVSTTR